jgi:hypothetical protein
MATSANFSRQWPPYPQIPIYLELCDDNGTSKSYNTITPISTNFRPQDGAIHALAAASTQYIRPVSPATTIFRDLSPIRPVHEPETERVQRQWRQPRSREVSSDRPHLHRYSGPVPEIREPGTESSDTCNKSDYEGLGISYRPFSSEQIATLSATCDADMGSPPNIAQRIEQRLWRYTSSRSVVKRWLLEIISWLVSALCMGAIILTLYILKDHALPKWPKGLTLNAFIAVLAKVAGAALILPTSEALGQLKWSWFQGDSKKMWDFEIFDNASRGPWGSLLLLIRTKGQALAALGALITLFSLALDPFFQQVVDFPERWTLMYNSSIPRVHMYRPRLGIEFQAGVEVTQQDQDVAAIAQKFLYDNGTQPMALGNGTRPDIPLVCPTSNCTWPPYETLGVCSACEDVSELLTFTCLSNITIDWTVNTTGSGTESTYPKGHVCGYFLNATGTAPVLMSGYMVEPKNTTGETLLTRALPLVTDPDRFPLYGGSYKFKHIRNPITDFFIVTAANGTDSVLRHQAPIALECMLTWCVKTVSSAYRWGMYDEQIIHETINTTAGPSPWLSIPFVSEGLNGTDTYYLQNISIESPSTPNKHFGLENATAMWTIQIFDDFLPSWTTVANDTEESILRFKFANNDAPNWRKLQFNPWLAPNNITKHMERLATALTNGIRSSNSSESIRGNAYDTQTYVSVRWKWLTLPLGLLFLSAIFLVSTIIKTGKGDGGHIGVWKTSAIATLLYGLPDDVQAKITSSASKDNHMGTPRMKAKELKVKILPSQGWRVSGGLVSPMAPDVSRNQPPPGWI